MIATIIVSVSYTRIDLAVNFEKYPYQPNTKVNWSQHNSPSCALCQKIAVSHIAMAGLSLEREKYDAQFQEFTQDAEFAG